MYFIGLVKTWWSSGTCYVENKKNNHGHDFEIWNGPEKIITLVLFLVKNDPIKNEWEIN